MEFSSEENMKEIFQHLDKFEIDSPNKSDKIIKSLYKTIKKAIEANNVFEKTEKKVEYKNDILGTDLFDSKYVPQEVNDYIDSKLVFSLEDSHSYVPTKIHYTTKVGSRKVEIFFILFEEEERIDIFANYVISWLMVLDKYSDKMCSNSLKIHFVMTDLKKKLPTDEMDILGVSHCNSAVTYACAPKGEMLIFRKQEWFKVFIHETFHSYGLDFSTMDTLDFNKKIKHIYPIKSEFNLFESYTEFWATIINCIYNSYVLLDGCEDILYFDLCIKMEQIFSLFQCAKILRFMGLSYKQLYSDDDASVGMRKMMYKEKSNIFAYYIVKALLLYKYDDFLLWCKKHNKNILQFNNLKAFYTFIGKTYNDPNFLEHLNRTSFLQVSDFLKKTMRMTLLEIS